MYGMCYLYVSADEISREMIGVPILLFTYIYFHNYGITRVKPQRAAPASRERAPPSLPGSLSDLLALVQGRPVDLSSVKKLVVLQVVPDGGHLVRSFPAFESIAFRYSKDENLGFVLVSSMSRDETQKALKRSVLNPTIPVYSWTEPVAMPRDPVAVLDLNSDSGTQLAWAGHVMALEACLQRISSPESSSSDED